MAFLYQIDLESQQLIVDALGERTYTSKKDVLCHDASQLTSKDGLLVATHDMLDDILAHKQLEVISILPNISFVKKLCKTSQSEDFSIEPVTVLVIRLRLSWILSASFRLNMFLLARLNTLPHFLQEPFGRDLNVMPILSESPHIGTTPFSLSGRHRRNSIGKP